MWRFRFDDNQRDAIASLIQKARQWAKDNECAVGISEIALGVSLLKYGVATDLIKVGSHVVGTAFNSSVKTALASAGAGGLAGILLGNIGVVALGGAVGIPGVVLAGGASVIFGCAGYGAAKMVEKFNPLLEQGTTVTLGLAGSSLVAIAVALIVDGCKRLLGSNLFKSIKYAVSSFIKGVLHLVKLTCQVVLKTIKDLHTMEEQPKKRVEESESSANFTTFTVLVTLLIFHAVNFPLLVLLAILSPVWSSLMAVIHFSLNATAEEKFLRKFST